ncbi:MAG: SUF system Fe-S cluster assembly regulator [Steroidobacterales bacterium]
MLRISKLTDYATLILAQLAANPAQRLTAARLAAQTHLQVPTVSKLLKQMHRQALVESTRGLHGGYRLARPPSQISAAQILEALEGPVALTECASSENHCCIEQTCLVGRGWQRVNLAIRRSLQEVSLAELAGLSPAALTPATSLGDSERARPLEDARTARPSRMSTP